MHHQPNKRNLRLISAFLAAFVAVPGFLAHSAPANDNFATRAVLSGSSLTFTGTLVAATLESAETSGVVPPGALTTGGSVWWTWTAPQSTTVTIAILRDNLSVNSTSTSLDVYSGTNITSLTLLDENSFDNPSGRYVAFAATAGVSYQFRVAGTWNRSFALRLTATNPPVFIVPPQDCVVSPYGSAFFSTIASGLPTGNPQQPAAAYQWKFNGAPIPGQTAPSLLIHSVTTNQTGSYSVVASNAGGVTESAAVNLTMINTNPVPGLAALRSGPSAPISFSLTGEGGRWYAIESSQDILHWVTDPANRIWSTNTVWVKATNAINSFSVPRLGPVHFVRASLNVPTDICIAQMKQMRWGQYMVAIENRRLALYPVALSDIQPYVPLVPLFHSIIACPEGGTYSAPATIVNAPTCTLLSRGHLIASP